jgi:catechol 2,3-dioxygenase-like lactoylglutathione lyase family enzyme
MSDDAPTPRLQQVGPVFVPVSDQDRALEFYVGTLGFEKRVDYAYGDGSRWVEVAPSGSVVALALAPPDERGAPGGDATLCAFTSPDIEAERATMEARGVAVDAEVARGGRRRPLLFDAGSSMENPMSPMFYFRDRDGNRFLVVEAV